METGGTFQLRRRWPQTPGPCRLPARGSKCSGHLAAVKGCPFGRNSRPESAGPGRDARPLPHSLCSVWRRVSSSRYLGIAPVNVPPTLELPRHVDMCRRRFRRSGSLAVDLRTPASPLSTSGRSWGTACGVQGAPWRVSQATRQKQSKANHPLPRNGNGSLFNHVVNVCLKHREALIIL